MQVQSLSQGLKIGENTCVKNNKTQYVVNIVQVKTCLSGRKSDGPYRLTISIIIITSTHCTLNKDLISHLFPNFRSYTTDNSTIARRYFQLLRSKGN